MELITYLGLSNYYGNVELKYDEYEEQYYLTLGDHDYPSVVPVSEVFAQAVIQEFNTIEEMED